MNESFLIQFEELKLEFFSFITKICFLNGRTFLRGKEKTKINDTRQTRDICVDKQESAIGNISLLIFSWMHTESHPKIKWQYKSGRDFRKSLIQTPAQSWTSSEIKPCCSRSPSSLILKTSRDIDSKNFLGALFHCSTIFTINLFLSVLYPVWRALWSLSCCAHCLPASHYAQLYIRQWKAWLTLSIASPQAQVGASRSYLFSKLDKASSVSLFSQGQILQPANILVALHWPHSNLSASFLLWGSQHLMQYLDLMICALMSAK